MQPAKDPGKDGCVGTVHDLVLDARESGWATATCSIDEAAKQAQEAGWVIHPSRFGGPAIDELRPVDRQGAKPRSLSASYGVDEQPLHTDGAHWPDPPDYLFLSAERATSVPTLIWPLPTLVSSEVPSCDLANGLFLVNRGRSAFLAPACKEGRIRYDPGCMTPNDHQARKVVDYLSAQINKAATFCWDSPGTLLVIDNRRILHARGSASRDPARVMRRMAVTIPGEAL